MQLLRLLTLALILTPAAAQSTWYVDGTATPPGSGTQASPFVTIQAAVQAASTSDGDTLLVAPGTYVEDVVIGGLGLTIRSTVGPLQTTLMGAALGGSVVRYANTTGTAHANKLEGFSIQAAGPGGIGILNEFLQSTTVERCIITGHAVGCRNEGSMDVLNSNVLINDLGISYSAGPFSGSLTRVNNTILWTNIQNFQGSGGNLVESFNLTSDPLFFGPTDYHLQVGSPCIDAGWFVGTLDPDGTILDIGALPFDPNYPLGESYCTPAVNSSGGPGTVLISGSTSIAANNLTLAATGCAASAAGVFMYGTQQVNLPFGNGVRCVGGMVFRLPIVSTDAAGQVSIPADLTTFFFSVGQVKRIQYWFRDPAAGGAAFNLTNAVKITIAP